MRKRSAENDLLLLATVFTIAVAIVDALLTGPYV
jgi:hypothetical protein